MIMGLLWPGQQQAHDHDSRHQRRALIALGNDWGEYWPFLISFVVIGNHWASHRQVFRYVNRVDSKVVLPNMLWLLMMIVTPFATRVLSAQGGGFAVRFTLYALLQIIASACLLLMSREIARGNLLRPDAPESVRHPDHVASLSVIIAFLVSIPVAFVVGGWTFAQWGAAPLLSRVLRRRLGGGRRTTSSPDRRRPAARHGS
jgi:uncharacterized membrane protein